MITVIQKEPHKIARGRDVAVRTTWDESRAGNFWLRFASNVEAARRRCLFMIFVK